MRENKFRAWWHAEKPDFYRGKQINPDIMLYDSWNGECLYFAYNGQPVTVMQYTGLKDIAQKEEYDGDLVRDDSGDIWRVSMDDPRGTTYIKYKTGEIVTAWDFLRSHVIIGNIHEIPELLEVKK